ncbi:chaoptin isoform X1 [Drosophila nasuta]|uniref:chaoptin isoform X1 n=1 Tax=Drosophila nasuta TaxID=42062 RepID=UPI00295EF12E|nr:chaoptin isoform X1 [Drosophila nasuta]XP_060663609.1 chaoptin isoform X1 [Drosophila nasuta]XP_060663618.1 chaoptin isoform X1 [Drosophila nasuta]
MQLFLALLPFLISTAHCWQFDGGGNNSTDTGFKSAPATEGRRHLRIARNIAQASSRGPPPMRESTVLLNSQQQDLLYSCPLNSMCQCAGLPNDTSTLIEINCNEVTLYKFPEFIHSSVRYIEMSNTHLQSVDDETFQGLRLKTLKLIDNELQDISERSFSTMTYSLMTLDISGNKMQKLPLQALQKLHSLTRLVAQRNYITSLDGNWEAQYDTLRSLHLAGNDITEVTPAGSLDLVSNSGDNSTQPSSLTVLQTRLDTSNTVYPAISTTLDRSGTRTFDQLQKLLWLDLSNNRIMHVSSNYMPRSLVTMDLSSNLLSVFPQQLFERLPELRIVSLRDNLLRSLQWKEIPGHPLRMHLEKLDLGQNCIESLESDYFHQNYSDVHIRALNMEQNYVAEVPARVFQNTGIVHLVLAFNVIGRVHPAAFDGLTDTLEYLDLERNRLITVPVSISVLHRLRYLYLTSNQINQLTNLPSYTDNLKVLSLSGNNFTMIPVLGLKNYTQLSYLNMGYNSITDIPEGIFAVDGWGANLQTILLRNNKITHIHLGSFSGLERLQEISLSFNDITIHHPLVFENVSHTLKILELSFAVFPARSFESLDPLAALQPLTQLIWLGLDNNNLKTISNESFARMRELSYINLSFNQLKTLPRGLFLPDIHSHIVEIELSYNVLEHLESQTFYNLGDLQTLNLQSNRLRSIARHAFHNMEFLRYIDLSHNRLNNISHSAFAVLPNLAALDVMYNQLCSFSLKSFHYVSNATTPLRLNASHNHISIFDDELSSYMYIYQVDISHNHVSKSDSFTNLANTLRFLNMAHNALGTLQSHAFGDLEFLEILNISYNNLSSLRRRSFQGLNSLQELDLSHNQLDQLQVEQFSNLRKLRVLRISSNRLRALPREVFMNTRLEFLDISENQLSVWPVPAFTDIGFTLRSIQMSRNNLEYLDASMFVNSQFLYDISLARNRITILPDNTFSFLNNLTNLDLSENPLVTTNLREVFVHTPRVRKLSLRHMGLYVLPPLKLPLLSYLDVSGNYLQELSPMGVLRHLRHVNISYNKIVNASCAIDHLPSSVRVLDVAHNPLRRITLQDLSSLRHLSELNLLDVKITNPQTFSKLRSLRKLHVSAHGNLGEIVSRLPGLQVLRVHCLEPNIGGQLLAKLTNNTKLQLVELYGNNVQTIFPDAFAGLSRNQRIQVKISHTRISDLPPGIFHTLREVPHLSIDISHNRINALAADSFYPNKSYWDMVGTRSIMGGLITSHNPLDCECGLVWFGHWLRRWLRESAQIKVIQKDDLKRMVQLPLSTADMRKARANTCRDPSSGHHLPILEIFPEDLLCQASALSSSGQRIFHFIFSFTLSLSLFIIIL